MTGAAVLALLLVAAAPGQLAPAAFRDRVAAAIMARTSRPVAIVDERTLRIGAPDDRVGGTISIDTVTSAYLADPSRLGELVDRLTRNAVEPDRGGGVDRLVVIVRPSDYLRRALGARAAATSLPSKPMAGDLSYFLAVDSAESIRTATTDDLARWGLTADAAWTRATANIKARLGPLTLTQLGSEGGASGLIADSGLAPSMLADPRTCSFAVPEGIGRQVVLVYARDWFLFARPDDPEDFARFWSTVREETAAGRSMSSTPLTCRNGRWTVAIPPGD